MPTSSSKRPALSSETAQRACEHEWRSGSKTVSGERECGKCAAAPSERTEGEREEGQRIAARVLEVLDANPDTEDTGFVTHRALRLVCLAALRSPVASEADAREDNKREKAMVYARTAIEDACLIIERGDQRLLAQDGPVNNQPPDLTLKEWRKLYVTLDKARKRLWEVAAHAE